MTRHQKRLSVPKSWPVERKTEVFTVKARAGPHGEAGVPLLILMRDVLGYVDSRKEARYALDEGGVLVNGEAVADERRPIGMFDIVAFPERHEHYRVFPDEGGRLALSPIDAEAADSRLGKIVGKQQAPGGVTQLTLHDGTTITADVDAYDTDDSIVIDVDDASVVAHFPYEEGALVTAVSGNHGGKIGTLASIDVTLGSGSNVVTVEQDEGTFETIEEYVFVIDEHFVGDDEPESDASADDDATSEDAESDDAPEDETAPEDSDEAVEETATDDEEGGETE